MERRLKILVTPLFEKQQLSARDVHIVIVVREGC